MNQACSLCNEWIEGNCGGIQTDPGGCWVEMEPTGDTWAKETEQMVDESMIAEDLSS